MKPELHADHMDVSGAYGQKYQVIKELVDKGLLTQVPEEFLNKSMDAVPVEITTESANTEEEWDMTDGHADHYDVTGRYAIAYEAKYGAGKLSNQAPDEVPVQQEAENSWKKFLQNIIVEEKSKLKV